MTVMEQRTFQHGVPVVALKNFACAGTWFRRGERFPWADMGLTAEKVERMFKARWLRHDMDAIDLDRLGIKALQSLARKRGVPTRRSRAEQIAELQAVE